MGKPVPSVRAWRLCIWMLGAALVACASGRQVPPFAIRVVPDPVTLDESPQGAGFHASALVRNDAARPLYVRQLCGVYPQRQIEGRWVIVWTPVCMSTGGLVTVPPHDSTAIEVDVFGFRAPDWAPRLDPRLTAGRYRLLVALGYDPVGIMGGFTDEWTDDERSSLPFVIRDGTPR